MNNTQTHRDMNRYNGWTNYATWRVNLEVFSDNEDLQETLGFDGGLDTNGVYRLAEGLKQYLLEYVDECVKDSMISGWVDAWLEDVNFYEIADKMNEHYTEIAQ